MGETLKITPTESVEIVPTDEGGTVHTFWNRGEGPARVRWRTAPAGRTEQWFRALDWLLRPVLALLGGAGRRRGFRP